MSKIAFQIPQKINTEKINDFNSTFVFKPLEKGYGATIGNTLRRVLLSSLDGYAITSLKIPSIQHEFSTIPGVREDVVELILNLKQVRFRHVSEPVPFEKIITSFGRRKVFKAGDLAQFTANLEIVNPDLVICHLDTPNTLELELTIERGRGYVPAEENKLPDAPLGLIPIDAIFTPIKKVSHRVNYVRVGQKTDFEELSVDVQTDGSILPQHALEQAANIIVKHFSLILEGNIVTEVLSEATGQVTDANTLRVSDLLKQPLTDFELSARAFNCLKAVGIETLSDLVVLEVAELVKFRNFGKKSLEELEALLAKKGLHFGMDIAKYNL